MEEKKISEIEYNEAVTKTIKELLNDSKIEDTTKVITAVAGMLIAGNIKTILFGKED